MTDTSHREPPSQRYEPVGDLVSIFPRGDRWYANWQMDGRQHRKSLRTSSKKEARIRAIRLESRLLSGQLAEGSTTAPLDDVIDSYLEHLETERRKEKTRRKYQTVLGRFKTLAKSKGIRKADQISIQLLDAYRNARVKAGRAPKTIYTETVILRQLVNFAISRGLVDTDPLKGMKIREPKPNQQPCWSWTQLEDILKACDVPQRSVFTVLADTGMRIGELQWLTWNDIDLKNNVIHIRPKDEWTPKSGVSRAVPISNRVLAIISGLRRSFRWVFTSPPSRKYPEGGRQISERRLLTYLKRRLKRLGLVGKLHTFRHTFISHLISQGTPEAVVREIVGHVDERVIRLYTHIADQRSQEAIRSLNGPPNGSTATHVRDVAEGQDESARSTHEEINDA